MKSLSLFVDKWFITVAANINGNVMPLSLPNGEDRIWLYFHEDTANQRIVYGKTFENNYRDKEPHYFGDIFPLIETDEYHFTRYHSRPEDMKEIFKVSNIFSHLHEAIEEQDTIDTYISFSTDITEIARYKFIQELEEAKFNVIESVARISHLALEESRKRSIFAEDGMYLTLVATNDNLHYALYWATENVFIRKREGTLPGLGLDVRKRALIESVVENINRTTKFLSTQEEYAYEYKRQERFADDWLKLIAKQKPGLPVTLSNITFAVAPYNPYPVTIKAIELDKRTKNLVDNIVREIAEFVRTNNVQFHEIKGIVFIGNTFTNSEFSAAIKARFNVDKDKLVIYREAELPKIVGVYSQIDCKQFREATEEFIKDAKVQEELNRQAREEEKRRKIAAEEEQRRRLEKEQRLKSKKDYANAIENVERFEHEHDYKQMLDWADIALKHRPDDEYAKEKRDNAQRLLWEQREKDKRFEITIRRAKTAYNEERWSDAISQCDMALEMRPDSDDAKRIKRESKQLLDIKEKITNFLYRADSFFAQKLYSKALEEVEKILNLDAANKDAKKIQSEISKAKGLHEEKVRTLAEKLNESETKKDFVAAIQICESLIEEDAINIRKWTSKRERLITKQKEFEKNKRRLDQLKEEINKAHFDEDWDRLKSLCEIYLNINQNEDIIQFLHKANKRLEEQKAREAKDKALASINGLIVERRFKEAEKEINRFARDYPFEHQVVKDLRSRLFSFNSERTKQTTSNLGDDFFDAPTNHSRKQDQSKRKITPKKNPIHMDGRRKDDFFDRKSGDGNANTSENRMVNKDFNF